MAALLWAAGPLIRRSPNLRYGVSCLMLFSMPVVLGITTLRSYSLQQSASCPEFTRGRTVSAERVAVGDSSDNRRADSETEFISGRAASWKGAKRLAGWVVCIWFAGV